MPRFQAGFTLVELMVTIAVAAILLTVGVPSLKSLYDGYRGSSSISQIQQTLAFARNQAVSYGRPVWVCAAGDITSSTKSCGSDWKKGIWVYFTEDSKIEVIKVVDAFNSNDNVKGGSYEFRADGMGADASKSVTFIYCPNNESTASRSAVVSPSGMVREGPDNQTCN
ncbi:GspH/FimT family pseudopilin [Shewanella avicenniae]|uniref:Type II secretion system protein H n=1 Tax=Shewanella avicenniae TaxID=2814294 RepID=A0ABX7QN50_9GAMM|nr:GspH/FimT family pseudopilin [Shewanella avicenniae]QSX32882.1 GspH/FimT family pseudopilin [Shewanella avicenniae]